MKPCDLDDMKLAAYLDGELNENEAAAVHGHIAGCAACAAEVAAMVSLKRSLRVARSTHAPGEEFRARLRSQLVQRAQPAAAKKHWLGFRWAWTPAALALAAMLFVGAWWISSPRRGAGLREAVDLHLNALASANPLDVVSTDRHTVKPWFQGRIPFSFNLPEFAGTTFVLQGARMAYLQRQPGAQLFVGIGQHKVSVLIFQQSGTTDATVESTSGVVSRSTFNVESWHSSSLRFILVGDADPAAMARLGQMLQQANP